MRRRGEAGTQISSRPCVSGELGHRGLVGFGIRRRQTPQQITEARGPAASLRRDALFRRMLLVADVVAIAGTFLVVTQLSSRPLQLTWVSIVGVPILLVGAKLFGLVRPRRDAAAQDDARRGAQAVPAGDAVRADGVAGGRTDRQRRLSRSPRGAVPVAGAARWLVLARARRGRSRCAWRRSSAACSSAMRRSARTIRSKLTDHGGIKATMVAHLDLDKAAPWSTDALLAAPARGDPRSGAAARRAPRDRRAAAARRPARCSTWCAR